MKYLSRSILMACVVVAWAALAQGAPPQPQNDPNAAADAENVEVVAPDSPRASLSTFLELASRGDYDRAAAYLDLRGLNKSRGHELALRLKAVLDRHVWFDLSEISPLASGDPLDGLPDRVDRVASIPVKGQHFEPVRMSKQQPSGRWVFSRGTVSRIDGWYEMLGNKWLIEHLPEELLRVGPRELLYWQWLALPLIVFVAWLLGMALGRLTQAVLSRLAARTSTRWDNELVNRLPGPLAFAWAFVAAEVMIPALGLSQPAQAFIDKLMRGAFLLIFFWIASRLVEVARQVLTESPWAKDHPASRSLVPLGARVCKVVVWIVAAVALLSEFGYPVASLIAGLGIGGLAFALAAQKTVENLFGAFSIGADQPFREGDFVKIEDFVGTVETIGLRSTRIRTLDRTLITVPNGRLADMRLESFAVRDRLRLSCIIGLVYETTPAQMRQVLEKLEQTLRAHPKIWPDSVVVKFSAFGASSLDIEIMAWFQTQDWGEFQGIRQEIFLQFMDVVEAAGSSFAFPTRTVHLVRDEVSGRDR